MTHLRSRLRLILTLLLVPFALSGCAVAWLSSYDARTDDMVVALQKAVSLQVETLNEADAPACFYPASAPAYRAMRVDLGALRLRVTSIEKNDPTIAQVESLGSAIGNFEGLHKIATRKGECMSVSVIALANDGIQTIFRAILKLEIAKKRGIGA